jgi:DNA modification methylase
MRKEVIGLATLYLGDCREIAPGLERPAAVISDPPYGLGDKMQGGTWGATATRADMLRWDQAPPSADDMAWIRALTDRVVLWGGAVFRASSKPLLVYVAQGQCRSNHGRF